MLYTLMVDDSKRVYDCFFLNKSKKYCSSQYIYFCYTHLPLHLLVSCYTFVSMDNHMGGRPLEHTLNSTPAAAVAKETLHCQNKAWPTHFSYTRRSSFESLPKEVYTYKYTYIKTKTVTNKPQARATLNVWMLSLSMCCFLRLSTCHDDKMINCQPLCKGQGVTVQPRIKQALQTTAVTALFLKAM